MFEFYAKSLREHDAAGRLQVAGVKWSEHRHGVVLTLAFAGALTIVFLTFAGVVVTLGNGRNAAVLLPPVGILIALYFGAQLVMWRTCALLLNADGSIATPYGIAYRRWWRAIKGDHVYITTFELRSWSEGCSVQIYSSGGDIVTLATKLPEYQAHKIVVLLNLALRDIRASHLEQSAGSPDHSEIIQPVY